MRCYKLVEKCPYPVLRNALSLTYKSSSELCREMGIEYATFRCVANGERIPNIVYAMAIANYFGYSTEEMFPLEILKKVGGFSCENYQKISR